MIYWKILTVLFFWFCVENLASDIKCHCPFVPATCGPNQKLVKTPGCCGCEECVDIFCDPRLCPGIVLICTEDQYVARVGCCNQCVDKCKVNK